MPNKPVIDPHVSGDGTIEDRIQTWLKKQGFPLELETAQRARLAGFSVSQSDSYIDPDEDTPREIDLVASVRKITTRNIVSYKLFLECKSSRDKPWLLLASSNDLKEPVPDKLSQMSRRFTIESSFVANSYGDQLIRRIGRESDFKRMFPSILVDSIVGHGVVQAFAEASDPPYKGITSASKAALAFVKQEERLGLSTSFAICAPVVVIDVPLFSVSLSPVGGIELNKIDRGVLHWKQVVGGRTGLAVHIVTREALPAFLTECKTAADQWCNTDAEELAELMAKENASRSPVRPDPGPRR